MQRMDLYWLGFSLFIFEKVKMRPMFTMHCVCISVHISLAFYSCVLSLSPLRLLLLNYCHINTRSLLESEGRQ